VAASILPADIAAGLRYGPTSQAALQRSRYLAEALQSMQQGANNIRTPTELASKLLATAILGYSKNAADRNALGAVRSDQVDYASSLLKGLGEEPTTAPAPTPMDAAPAAPVTPPAPTMAAPEQPTGPANPRFASRDIDAVARMMLGEAGGEGDQGMTAAGAVAFNRLKSGYGGANSLADVVYAPHQFEGARSPQASVPETSPQYQHALTLASALANGTAQDPTGGAINFLNPELQARLGRPQPAWAPGGQGQRIGHHVFYGGNPAAGAPVPPPPMPPDPNGAPVQLAMQGPMQPGMMSSAPAPSAGNGMTPAAPVLPPGAAGVAADQRITAAERAYAQELMSDPRTFDQGAAYIQHLRERAAAPTNYTFSMQDGVPVWADPHNPGRVIYGQVPPQLQYHQAPGGTPSAIVQTGPNGKQDYLTVPGKQGAVPEGMVYQNGALQRLPSQTQQTFRIPNVNGVFVNGPDGKPVKVGEDQYGPEQLFALRRQFIDSEAFKNFQQSKSAWDAMVSSAALPQGGMRAYALRDTFARAINPGAVARVGTIEAIKNAQGVPASVKAFFMNLQGDGDVPPEIAQQILDVTHGFVMSHYQDAQVLNGSNADYAKRHQIDPADVTVPMEAPKPFRVPHPTAAPQADNSTDAAIREAAKRGLPIPPQWQGRARQLGLIR
jgi:spore germination cell wall hydrolase CwlJ-like protein